MYKSLVQMWPDLTPVQVADKVKFFFKSYAQNRHKATTLTPSVHCEAYGVDDNRFDLRPIFIDSRWPWQFKKVDLLAEQFTKARQAPKL